MFVGRIATPPPVVDRTRREREMRVNARRRTAALRSDKLHGSASVSLRGTGGKPERCARSPATRGPGLTGRLRVRLTARPRPSRLRGRRAGHRVQRGGVQRASTDGHRSPSAVLTMARRTGRSSAAPRCRAGSAVHPRFEGRPGASSDTLASARLAKFRLFHSDRDLAFIGQGGTGDSNRPGFDPSPDDVDAVRAFLGHHRINLWGGSYGTRAARSACVRTRTTCGASCSTASRCRTCNCRLTPRARPSARSTERSPTAPPSRLEPRSFPICGPRPRALLARSASPRPAPRDWRRCCRSCGCCSSSRDSSAACRSPPTPPPPSVNEGRWNPQR